MGLFKKKEAEPVVQKEGDGQPIVSKDAVKERKKEIAEEEKKENKGQDKPADLAYVSLRHVDKVYDNGVQAVFDFTLDIKKHEFIVFVGPSGCGKSTTLRMIAGLEDITNGELYIDGEYSNDRSPKDRDIAMVFQSYALYPHMTVYNNMAFGLKIRHLPKAEIDKRVHDAAKILQIEEYLDRKPKALSGGQRQRVALGRAIVRNAKVFLMDEPLSNLDAKLRVQMRSEIIKLHEALNATTIYVTHDQTEAMTMATRIVVMKLGHIQQIGSPIEIYNHPANVFVAGFIGSPAMNLMKATYDNGTIVLSDGKKIKCDADVVKANKDFYEAVIKEETAQLAELNAAYAAKADEGTKKEIDELSKKLEGHKLATVGAHPVVFGIRPEDVHEVTDAGKAAGAYDIKVAVAELLGHEYYVHTDFAGIDLVAKIPLTHEIKLGDTIKVTFDLPKGHIFDPETEKRIF
jgi:multiple sugar transport system ATP-binding protein